MQGPLKIREYLLLAYEFFRPSSVGVYCTPQELYPSPHWPHKPSRTYLALSHRLLYFQKVNLPVQIPPNKVASALRIEASRLLALIEGRENLRASCAFLSLNGESYLIAFQDQERLLQFLQKLPSKAVPCGLFPAWVALWAWFKAQGELEDAIYLVEEGSSIQGFIWERGKLKKVLPSSYKAAQIYLENSSLKVLKPKEEATKVLAEGARLAPHLIPLNQLMSFDLIPLRLRPQIPKKAVALWLLPLLIWSAASGLESWQHKLHRQSLSLEQELRKLRQEEKILTQKLKTKETLKELATYIEEFQKRPPLLEALVELARILPPGSWVNRFYFTAPDLVKLWGESDNALEVIKKLEESPYFKDVKVLSSITKHPHTGKERFAIQARLEKAS